MTDFFYLIPVALALGAVGLAAFMWSLKSGQYEDLEGAAERILSNDDKPIVKTRQLGSSLEKESVRPLSIN
jgi:cbb3-type cytochrome oxidase maturation protein